MANLTAPDEPAQTAVKTEERQQLESRFKQALRNFGTAFQLPPTPEPPANLFTWNGSTDMTPEDRRAIWELQQDMAVIKQRYDLVVKIAWRTSAALLGLAAPLIGSDLLTRLVNLLGG
ncbi:MAG: hypothetical protein J0I20_07365 [Chloroflexi bacterium]|nr:hypothetical protein [Chloroflexota bacterium]OJV95244.1 MAG: hypothetical protein BGO39_24875 [Chloroflexi bacterium 54-19]